MLRSEQTVCGGKLYFLTGEKGKLVGNVLEALHNAERGIVTVVIGDSKEVAAVRAIARCNEFGGLRTVGVCGMEVKVAHERVNAYEIAAYRINGECTEAAADTVLALVGKFYLYREAAFLRSVEGNDALVLRSRIITVAA